MKTMPRSRIAHQPVVELDPCGVPCLERVLGAVGALRPDPPAGIGPRTLLVRVQGVEPPRELPTLVWGVADGTRYLFAVDARKGRELQVALDAGDEPSAIVEPDAIVAADVEPVR